MTSLNDLAPWPGMSWPASADAVARHMAVVAEATVTITHATPTDDPAWHHLIAKVVAQYGVVLLLRKLAEHAPHVADEVASELRDHWEDGASIDEFLWEWLTEYGIDPEQVSRIALDAYAKARTA